MRRERAPAASIANARSDQADSARLKTQQPADEAPCKPRSERLGQRAQLEEPVGNGAEDRTVQRPVSEQERGADLGHHR
jgi:hypothetical protein